MLEELRIVFTTDLLRRLRSKPFLIGTFAGAVLIYSIALLPVLFSNLGSERTRLILVGHADVTAVAAALLQRDDGIDVVGRIEAAPKDVTREFLATHDNAGAALLLTMSSGELRATAYASNAATFPGRRIGTELAALSVALATGIPAARAAAYQPPQIEVEAISGRYMTTGSSEAARGISGFIIFVFYIVTLVNSQMLTSAVAEEKTSRIAELLVSAISPSALLGGKLLSTGLAAALQIVVWLLTGFAVISGSFGHSVNEAASARLLLDVTNVLTPGIVLAFIVSFAIGFLEYGMLFAAAAALITRTEDLGSLTVPIVLPAVAALMIAQYALVSPDSPLVVVASFIPMVAPTVMLTRMIITDVAPLQIAITLAVNLAFLAIIIPLAGKTYRIGMLLYGRAPKLSQIWAVLRT